MHTTLYHNTSLREREFMLMFPAEQGYATYVDPYSSKPRLDLVRFDGSYVMPLYQVYEIPSMLPTSTLNPTPTATGAGAAKPNSKSRVKRELGELDGEEIALPLNHRVLRKRSGGMAAHWSDWVDVKQVGSADVWWWFGVMATGMGGVLYFCF